MNTLLFCIGVGVVVYAVFSDLAKIARWAPVRWFFEGLFGGLGVRVSGVLRQPPQPRRRVRIIRSARAALDDGAREPPRPRRWSGVRADSYQPWDIAEGDDWPENLAAPRDPPRLPPR